MEKPHYTSHTIGIKPPHPGKFFDKTVIEGRDLQTISKQMGIKETILNEFINGERQIDNDLAKRLAHFTGMPAFFWQNMQDSYTKWQELGQENPWLKAHSR